MLGGWSRPKKPQERHVKDDSHFWDQYVKEAEIFDKELIKGLGSDLDTLLIFAGLFSAVNTAFITESYQDLKPDPAESGGTNDLLRTLVRILNNSTITTTTSIDFAPPARAVAVNALFFASLCCSLFSAFGAVLAKQWLNEYERMGTHRDSYDRAHHRHAKYLGMERYRSEMLMQALGTVLQVSLFLFFIALTNWLWGINHMIATVAIVGVAVTFALYFTTTIISIYDSTSPFSTRFSTFLREFCRSKVLSSKVVSMIESEKDRKDEQMDGKCIAWVRDYATMFESVVGMARVAVRLPREISRQSELEHRHLGPILLHSIISNNAIPFGITNGSLFVTVNALQDAMTTWKDVQYSLACDVISQLHQVLRLTMTKDPSLSEAIIMTLQRIDLDDISGVVFWTRPPEMDEFIDYIQMPSLTLEGMRAGLSLLWKYQPLSSSPRPNLPHITWQELREAVSPDLGLPKESWPWIIADALVETIGTGELEDMDEQRLEMRMEWAAALGPDHQESEMQLYGDIVSVSPRWIQTFGKPEFQRYVMKHSASNRIAARRVAMVLLHNHTVPGLLGGSNQHCYCEGREYLDCGLIGVAFNIDHIHTGRDMLALYWWFHLHEVHSHIPLPPALVTRQYIRSTIFQFLLEQLKYPPMIRAERVPRTVLAIRAYLAQFKSLDLPAQGSAGPDDLKQLAEISGLLNCIRDGSHRFQGAGPVGQELWDCFKLVVPLLHPGEGAFTYAYWEYTVGLMPKKFEGTIDWDEMDAVRICGLDPMPISDTLPSITGDNFLGFDLY